MDTAETVTLLCNALLNTCGISDISLTDGMFGYVLPLYRLSRRYGYEFFSSFADSLLEDCIQSVHNGLPYGFSSGVAGIGWAVEFLIGKGFIIGDPDEVLWEFDRKVEELCLFRIHDRSWDRGLYGIALYLFTRVASSRIRGKGKVFTDTFENELDELTRHDKEIAVLAGLDFEELLEKGYSLFLDLISRHNPELYSVVELMETLVYKPVYDRLDRPSVYVFTEECRGQKYGVGTYLNEMISISQLKEACRLVVVHLRSDMDAFSISRNGPITHLWFPDLLNLNVVYGTIPQLRYSKVIAISIKAFHQAFCPHSKALCHTNFFGWTDMVAELKEFLTAKIVHTMHYSSWSFETLGDVAQLESALASGNLNRLKSSFLKEAQYLREVCDCVIAISRHSYSSLISLYGLDKERTVYIPNPVGMAEYPRIKKSDMCLRYGWPEDVKIVIFAGRLDSVKGLDHLIMSMRTVIEHDRSVMLAIAGCGDFQKYLELAKPYSRNIIFLGFLDKEELLDWYRVADVGVVASLYEEFGYVCIEMLMEGLPVIANDTTGLSEIVRSSGMGTLVNIKDYEHTSKAISSMLSSIRAFPEECKRSILASQYSRDTFAQSLINLYGCLIG